MEIKQSRLKIYSHVLEIERRRKPNLLLSPLLGYIAVGIYANNLDEINLQFNSWYNWKATSGKLHYLNSEHSPFFAYIISDKQKYINYLFNVLEHRFAMQTKWEFTGENHFNYLMYLAEQEYSLITREDFYSKYCHGDDNHYYAFSEKDFRVHQSDKMVNGY